RIDGSGHVHKAAVNKCSTAAARLILPNLCNHFDLPDKTAFLTLKAGEMFLGSERYHPCRKLDWGEPPQNLKCNPNCTILDWFVSISDVIRPNAAAPRFRFGKSKFGLLMKFMISERNWTV